jgi:hypothetical protein
VFVAHPSRRPPLCLNRVGLGDIADGLWYLDLIRSEAPIDPMRTDLIFDRDFVVAAA